jgi:predicted nucleotide-binding protein (sugar kinase/HSP70/actin superfamily)
MGDNMTIGIPRSLFYYYSGEVWTSFLDNLNVKYILSPKTNQQIINLGAKYSADEMCLSLKNFIGHVAFLVGKCDCILVPRIDNYGRNDQTCTNFLAAYDIIRNLFPVSLLTYNINYLNKETEEEAFLSLGKQLGFSEYDSLIAYHNAITSVNFKKEKKIIKNIEMLNSKEKKILLIGHPYNIYDAFIGEPIIHFIEQQGIQIVYANLFHDNITRDLSKKLSSTLYFKYNKELIGSILLCEEFVDGIIFLTTFPCGPDSLVNELVFRKLKKPYLELVIDDLDSQVGFETRIESFIDILERNE